VRWIAIFIAVLVVVGCATRKPAPVTGRVPPPPPAPAAAQPAVPGAERTDVRPETYVVQPGDTLVRIAAEFGVDFRELAALNGIENPNVLRVGQVLRLRPPATGVVTAPLPSAPQLPETARTASVGVARPNTEVYKTQPKAVREPYSEQVVAMLQREAMPAAAAPSAGVPGAVPSAAAPGMPGPGGTAEPADTDAVPWVWPTSGPVVAGFSEFAPLKGIDISGRMGQAVVASADGRVVYAGSGLRGYGKLIIIKHNKTYLSAYAHNSQILVKEGQQVTRGQKIAEMGDSDADQVKLHFEIRREGRPVDPARYLPPPT